MADEHQFCTFYLDGMYFGVEVQKVQEVIRHLDITPVPLAPAEVRGLINLRGQIVTAFDLRQRLGMPQRAGDAKPMNVVVRAGDGVFSLLVDEIGDVLTIDSDSVERPPENVSGVAKELLSAVFKLKDRLMLLLDTEKVVNLSAIAA